MYQASVGISYFSVVLCNNCLFLRKSLKDLLKFPVYCSKYIFLYLWHVEESQFVGDAHSTNVGGTLSMKYGYSALLKAKGKL